MTRRSSARDRCARIVATACVLAGPVAYAQGTPAVDGGKAATPDSLDLRLTLSSFLYRESGQDAPALVADGAPLQTASPVQRFFGDLRLELSGGGLAVDARVRQTTNERFQSGADGGGEYELRTLAYRLGGTNRSLSIGRQYLDGLGGSKIDGLAFRQKLAEPVATTLFAGAFPIIGSRSVETDYPTIRMEDGTDGKRLIPVVGGLALAFESAAYHGDVGAAAVYVPQAVPMATTQEKSRVFATASGYLRAGTVAEIYHFALLDIAGQSSAQLTNGSVGVTVHPHNAVQLGLAVNHASTDALQIATRNLLEDPDPTAGGVVQNDIALIRVSQDAARASASLALAHQRFEITVAGGVHRRPAVSVELADGSAAVVFPEARNADASFAILDRHSVGDLRVSLLASLTQPIGSNTPNASHGASLRAAAGKAFAQDRGSLELDVMAGRFRTVGRGDSCTASLDPLACYGTTKVLLAQAGALATWRVSREWLLLVDIHGGYRDIRSTVAASQLDWPSIYTVSGFVRAQWRFR